MRAVASSMDFNTQIAEIFRANQGVVREPMDTVQIEVPGDPIRTVDVSVQELTGTDRDRVWAAFTENLSGFADYEKSAGERVIPVFRLAP